MKMPIRTKRIKVRDTTLSYQEQAILIRGFANKDSVNFKELFDDCKYCILTISEYKKVLVGMMKNKKLLSFSGKNLPMNDEYISPTLKGFDVRATAITHLIANQDDYRAKGELDER